MFEILFYAFYVKYIKSLVLHKIMLNFLQIYFYNKHCNIVLKNYEVRFSIRGDVKLSLNQIDTAYQTFTHYFLIY